MQGITVWYDFDGDEAAWQAHIDTFISAVNADPAVAGKFTYQVAKAKDGATRIHWGRWDSAETLAALQATDYFKAFTSGLKALLGETPNNIGHDVVARSAGW